MTFDDFWKQLNDNWRRARTPLPPPSIDYARQKYTEQFPDQPPIFREGPTRDEWRDQVRSSMPNAPLEEIDAKYDQYYSDSAWNEAVRAGKRGVLRLGESMAGISDVLMDMSPVLGGAASLLGQRDKPIQTRERLGSMADDIPKAVAAQTGVWDEPAQLANPGWWAANLPEVATSQLPVIGGFLLGGPVGAGAVGAAMEGESTYRSAQEQGLGAPGLRGAGMGAAAGVLNAIPFAGRGANLLMRGLAEGATEAAEEIPGAFLESPVPRSGQEALGTLQEAGKRAVEVAPLAAVTGAAMNVPALKRRVPAERADTTQFKAEIQQAIENQPTIDPRLSDDAHRVDLQIKMMEAMPQGVPTPAPDWMADIGADRAQVGLTIQKALRGDPMARAEREILSKVMDKSEVARPPGVIRSPGGRQRGAIGSEPPSGPVEQPIAPDILEMGQGRIKARKFSAVGDDGLMILQQVADDWGGEIDAQRRGKRTWSQTETAAVQRLADATGLPMKELLNRRTGSAANAEQLESFSKIIVEQTRRVQEKARAIKEGKDSSEDLVEFRTLMDELAVLQAPFAGYVAEAGRALNQMRKITSTSQEARVILEAMNQKGDVKTLADKVASTEDPAAVAAQARDFKPGFWDYVYEYRTSMGLLSGFRTHAVNLIGNTSMIGAEMATQLAAPIAGGQSVRQSLATVRGMTQGIMLGLRNAARAAITEEPQLEPMTKFDVPHTKAIPGMLGKIIRAPGFRALTAEDEFFKGIGFMGRLYGVATRESEKIGGSRQEVSARANEFVQRIRQKMDANKDLNEREMGLVKEAIDYARHVTFQDPLGPTAAHLQSVMNRHKWSRVFLVPFFRTPINLFKTAVDYSPIGYYRAAKNKATATDEQTRLALTRATIGSAVAAYVFDQVASGLLTGFISDDRREQELHQIADGKMPYSRKVGDQWYSYMRMDPFAMQVGVISDLYTLRNYATPDEYAKIPMYITMSLAENLGNKTWMQGVADFVEMYGEPFRYGEGYFRRQAGSFVPAALSQAASNMDPYYRQAHTMVEELKKRVPQKRQELALAMNVAGQPMPNPYQSYVPFATVPPSNDILAAKMLEIGMIKDKPQDRLLNTDMTPEEYESYSRFVGQMRWNALTPISTSPEFNRLPHPFQLQILEKLWDSTGYKARQAWLINNPEFMTRAATERVEQLTGTAGP